MSQDRPHRHARIVLAVSMLVMGGCGIIYEYVLGVLGNNLMGSSHEQIFVIIGIMMFAMGVGAILQRHISTDLVDRFLGLELALGLVGGLAPLAIYTAFVYTVAYPVLLYGLAFLIGAMIGLEIPLLIRINQTYSASLRTNLSEILSMDYVGALIGALLFAYVLISRVSVGSIGIALGMVNVVLALGGTLYFRSLVRRRGALLAGGILGLAVLAVALWRVDGIMASLEQRCYQDPIVYRETSPYQHLVLTRRGDRMNFYINGHLQLSSRDEFIYHDMLVHVPMHAASRRDRVLILGGGDGMALREVLRYGDVREVTLVDLDPAVVRLFAEHPDLIEMNRAAFHDARVHTLAASGVSPGDTLTVTRPTHLSSLYLDNTVYPLASVRVVTVDADLFVRDVPGAYDVVLIDFPDPATLELAKLFSVGFYRRLAGRLAPGAVVGLQATSPWHAKSVFLSIGATLEAAGYEARPYHENVPSFGEWGWYLAWRDDRVRADPMGRIAAVDELDVNATYLTPELMRAAFVFAQGWLESDETIRPNTRMQPMITTYYRREWR